VAVPAPIGCKSANRQPVNIEQNAANMIVIRTPAATAEMASQMWRCLVLFQARTSADSAMVELMTEDSTDLAYSLTRLSEDRSKRFQRGVNASSPWWKSAGNDGLNI
jgi:hypothetical protein